MEKPRVRMTVEAIAQGLHGRKNLRTGVLCSRFSDGNGKMLVSVLRDGKKYRETYSDYYWQPEMMPDEIVEATISAFLQKEVM